MSTVAGFSNFVSPSEQSDVNNSLLLAYADELTKRLHVERDNRGGRGSTLISVMSQDENFTLVRILFSDPFTPSRITASHNDREYERCHLWLQFLSDVSDLKIAPGRIALAGDLCVMVKDRLPEIDDAEYDAHHIVSIIEENIRLKKRVSITRH